MMDRKEPKPGLYWYRKASWDKKAPWTPCTCEWTDKGVHVTHILDTTTYEGVPWCDVPEDAIYKTIVPLRHIEP